jgi:hypothetical protein
MILPCLIRLLGTGSRNHLLPQSCFSDEVSDSNIFCLSLLVASDLLSNDLS